MIFVTCKRKRRKKVSVRREQNEFLLFKDHFANLLRKLTDFNVAVNDSTGVF